MQNPVVEYSFEVNEETSIEEQCYILKVTEPWEDHLDLTGKSGMGNEVSSSCDPPTPPDVEMKLCPTDTTRRYGFSDHLLKVPSMKYDDGVNTLCQFDRHAPARISTSPTLRRLRNSTSTLLQDSLESPRLGSQKHLPDSCFPVSQATCSEHPSSSSNTNSHLSRDNCTSLDTTSIFSHHKDSFIDGQTLQEKGELNGSSRSEEQDSQKCDQVSNLANNKRENNFSSARCV